MELKCDNKTCYNSVQCSMLSSAGCSFSVLPQEQEHVLVEMSRDTCRNENVHGLMYLYLQRQVCSGSFSNMKHMQLQAC